MKLDKKIIKEITDEIISGLTCYIHKQTKEIKLIPKDYDDFYGEFEDFDKLFDELKENADDYYKIENMDSFDAFKVMENFLDEIEDDKELVNILADTLINKRPFANFKNIIDYSDYREKWFEFHFQQNYDRVKKIIKKLK